MLAETYNWTAIRMCLHNFSSLPKLRTRMRKKLFAALLTIACLWAQTGTAQAPGPQLGTSLLPWLPAPQAAPSLDLAGDWNGVLDVQGKKFRLVLRLNKNAGNKLTGALDSLDQQGANGIPLSSTEQAGDDLKVELSSIAASYQGKLDASGNEITGEWKQHGMALPLIF